MKREFSSVLWALPCACFTVERAAQDWIAYNSGFTVGSNHDETWCNAADLAKLPNLNRKGFIFAHFSGPSPLDQVRSKADMPNKYLGTKITKDQVSTHIAS